MIRRLDDGLDADVREIGDREHVHHAPEVVGVVALRRGADRLPYATVRAVAAHDIPCANDRFSAVTEATQRSGNGIVALGLDLQCNEFDTVIGLEPRGRLLHVLEQVLLQARLVDDDVREFGQPVLGVLDAPGALDVRAIARRRAPEHRLVHPIGLPDQPRTQTKGLERLDGATRDAVGAAKVERAPAPLDQARTDVRKRRELRGKQGAGRPAADDQHVDFVGKRRAARLRPRCCGQDVGVARAISVQIELHALLVLSRWR